MKCNFMDLPCELRFARYRTTANIAVELVVHNPDGSLPDVTHGEHICFATTNIDPLADDRVSIKNWSENVGMVEALADAGLIEALPCDYLSSGFVMAPVHMLTTAGMAEVLAMEVA